jgi:DNA-binding NarL/FixJ family response regulator
VRVIRRSATHMADLVNGLLDISRIENGTLLVERGRVNLSEMLGETRLHLTQLGSAGGEHFFRLAEATEGREEIILKKALKLTVRESDVLVWIARGKSNRDISEVLNISARTVNKHL